MSLSLSFEFEFEFELEFLSLSLGFSSLAFFELRGNLKKGSEILKPSQIFSKNPPKSKFRPFLGSDRDINFSYFGEKWPNLQ